MSRIYTYELSDEVSQAIDAMSLQTGMSPEVLVLRYLARQASIRSAEHNPNESRAARERFSKFLGSVSMGGPTGADDQSIEEDLVREYGSSHEDKS